MLIKNWKKIKNNKIKLKYFKKKIFKINMRKTLIKNNFLDLDNKMNKKEKQFVMNCLAQDFDFLKMQIKIFNNIYDCKIDLSKASKKKWQ